MFYYALLQTAFARLMRNVPGYVAPSYEWIGIDRVSRRHGSWHNVAFEVSFTLTFIAVLSFILGGWSHPARSALVFAYLIGVLGVLPVLLIAGVARVRRRLVVRHHARTQLHGDEWSLVNEAIVVWSGFGELATPSRDELRLRRHLGRRCTPRLIATLWKAEDEFYRRASSSSVDAARRSLQEAHPAITDQSLDALAWCYQDDWARSNPAPSL